jgi:hypothetical protein
MRNAFTRARRRIARGRPPTESPESVLASLRTRIDEVEASMRAAAAAAAANSPAAVPPPAAGETMTPLGDAAATSPAAAAAPAVPAPSHISVTVSAARETLSSFLSAHGLAPRVVLRVRRVKGLGAVAAHLAKKWATHLEDFKIRVPGGTWITAGAASDQGVVGDAEDLEYEAAYVQMGSSRNTDNDDNNSDNNKGVTTTNNNNNNNNNKGVINSKNTDADNRNNPSSATADPITLDTHKIDVKDTPGCAESSSTDGSTSRRRSRKRRLAEQQSQRRQRRQLTAEELAERKLPSFDNVLPGEDAVTLDGLSLHGFPNHTTGAGQGSQVHPPKQSQQPPQFPVQHTPHSQTQNQHHHQPGQRVIAHATSMLSRLARPAMPGLALLASMQPARPAAPQPPQSVLPRPLPLQTPVPMIDPLISQRQHASSHLSSRSLAAPAPLGGEKLHNGNSHNINSSSNNNNININTSSNNNNNNNNNNSGNDYQQQTQQQQPRQRRDSIGCFENLIPVPAASTSLAAPAPAGTQFEDPVGHTDSFLNNPFHGLGDNWGDSRPHF